MPIALLFFRYCRVSHCTPKTLAYRNQTRSVAVLGFRLPGARPECLDFPRKSIREGASSLFGRGPESPKNVSCSRATQTCTGATLGLPQSRRHFGHSPALARKDYFQKNPRVRKFVSAILGPEMAAPIFMGTWKNAPLLQEKSHVHKIPRFRGGGGILGFWGGGGEVPIFIFMGAGIFLILAPSLIDFRGNPGIRALYQAIGIPMAVRERPPALIQHVLTALAFWCWVLLAPGFDVRLGASNCSPGPASCFMGPTTFAWICCLQLNYHSRARKP